MSKQHESDIVERFTQGLYHAMPRRSFLALIAKGLIGLVGVAIAEALPVDRTTMSVEAHTVSNDNKQCTYWKYCNLNTASWWPCSCCSQPDCQCPYGTLPGPYWIGCCHDTSGANKQIRYYDCAKSQPTVQCPQSCTIQCHNAANANGADSHSGAYDHSTLWANNSTVICTAVCVSGTC